VPPLLATSAEQRTPPGAAPLTWTVRVVLVVTLAGLAAMFVLAHHLDPYDAEGRPRELGTHEQLGLPPCSFRALTGKPCPSCGMTTSISLAAHGDVRGSLRVNWVGSLVAVAGVLALPWAAFSLARNRLVGVRSLERTLAWLMAGFLVLSLARWGVLLAATWKSG
jgi:Protein of unknown function (DUF2752)